MPLLEVENLEWRFLIFRVPKKDKKQIRTTEDFRVLNTMLEQSPCYIEPIYKLLYAIGHFTWASNLDLPMAYYTMSLCDKSKVIMQLVTIFGIYECQVLWICISPASNIFQGHINFTLQDILSVLPKSYINNILAALKHSFDNHITYLDHIFKT